MKLKTILIDTSLSIYFISNLSLIAIYPIQYGLYSLILHLIAFCYLIYLTVKDIQNANILKSRLFKTKSDIEIKSILKKTIKLKSFFLIPVSIPFLIIYKSSIEGNETQRVVNLYNDI